MPCFASLKETVCYIENVNTGEALNELHQIKTAYRNFIRDNFESSARDCKTCPTFGACCVDAHFVNVHVTPLEAVAIREKLRENLSEEESKAVFERVRRTIEKYDLQSTDDTFAQTFACPLFEPEIGCLIHGAAKPVACISHACYENQEDLPPDCLQENAERKIEKLNLSVYDEPQKWLPLPIAINKLEF